MRTSILAYPGMPLPILDRQTDSGDVGDPVDPNRGQLSHAWYMLGWGDQWRTARKLDEGTALTISAVWACVRYISQTIASLGWHVFEKQKDDRAKLPVQDDIAWLLGTQASPEMNAFEFRQVLLKDALTYGNGYAEIDRTAFGKPNWLWRISPDRVEVTRDDAGKVVYEVRNGTSKKPTYLYPENVFHIRGLGPDGLVGYSVIEMARKSLELSMSEEDFGSKFYERGPMPGGVLEMPGNVKKQERDDTRNSFESTYGGSGNRGRVVVLSGGMKFTPLVISHEDAQFLEGRRFSIEDVCRWYGVPPHKIASLEQSTNNNIEQQSIEAVQDCLLPWARRLESEADIKLFGRVNRGQKFTRLNLATLLRGDSATQTDTITKKVTGGIMTVNEGREYLDLNPIDGGDTPLIQGAMVPLERVLEEPAPPEPLPQPTAPTQEPAAPPENLVAAFTPVLADSIRRLLRVEEDKAKRSASRGKLADHLEDFYGAGTARDWAIREFTPVLGAFMAAIGLDVSQPLIEMAASLHVRASVQTLRAYGADAFAGWPDRLAEAAETLRWLYLEGRKP